MKNGNGRRRNVRYQTRRNHKRGLPHRFCGKWDAGSVDMVITDPPYGVDYQSTRAAKENRKDKIAGDKRPFIWWIYDAYRVLKEGGEYCVSAAGMYSRRL